MAKISTVFQVLTLITLSLYAGALLFIAVAVVNFWQVAEPAMFLSWMSDNFYRFPIIMIPLNMASLLMLIAALATAWRSSPSSRLPLSLSLFSLLICTITFPIYFAGANAEFLSQTMALGIVSEKIAIWSHWHWFRTGLAVLSIFFASWALLNRPDEVAKA